MVRSSEVNHLNLPVTFGVDQDIFWLQITMGNSLCMAVSNGMKDLLNDNCGFLLSKVLLLGDLIEQFAPIAQLSHQEDAAHALVDLVQAHDVRVVQVL